MLVRQPTMATADEVSALRDYRCKFETLVNEYVEDLLAEIERDLVREQIQLLVFTPNDVLPKRETRPHLKGTFFTDQLYRAHAETTEDAEDLLKFALVHQEHWDVADDVFDGDVTSGAGPEVYLTSQALQPLLVRLLGRLGDDAVSYWTGRTTRMISGWFEELRKEPSRDAYATILDRHAEYYGALTGLAALIAGGDKSTVADAEQVGRTYFKFEQVLLDVDQHREGDADPWNAWQVMSEEEVLRFVHEWRGDITAYLAGLPDVQGARLRPLVNFDVKTWIETGDWIADRNERH